MYSISFRAINRVLSLILPIPSHSTSLFPNFISTIPLSSSVGVGHQGVVFLADDFHLVLPLLSLDFNPLFDYPCLGFALWEYDFELAAPSSIHRPDSRMRVSLFPLVSYILRFLMLL